MGQAHRPAPVLVAVTLHRPHLPICHVLGRLPDGIRARLLAQVAQVAQDHATGRGYLGMPVPS